MLIKENLLYKTQKEKTRYFDTNLLKTSNAFFINFLGFLSAYSKYPTDAKLLNYLKSDKSLRNISDNNNDLSLSAKLLFNHGVMSQQTFEEVTKFLYLLKSGKITSLQEDKLRVLLRKIYPNAKIKKSLDAVVKEFIKGASLKDIAYDVNQLTNIHGFLHITKEYRLVTKHLDFPAPDSAKPVHTTTSQAVNIVTPPKLANDLDKRIDELRNGSGMVEFSKEEIREIFAPDGKAQPLKSLNSINRIKGLDSVLRTEVIINYLSTKGVNVDDVNNIEAETTVYLSMIDKAVDKNPMFIRDIDDLIRLYDLYTIDFDMYPFIKKRFLDMLIHAVDDKEVNKIVNATNTKIELKNKIIDILKGNGVVLNDKLFYKLIAESPENYIHLYNDVKFSNPVSEYAIELTYLKLKYSLKNIKFGGDSRNFYIINVKSIRSYNIEKSSIVKAIERFSDPLQRTIIKFVVNGKKYNDFEFYRILLNEITGNEKIIFKDFISYIAPAFFTGMLTKEEEDKFIKYMKGKSISEDADTTYINLLETSYNKLPSDKYEKYYNMFENFSILQLTEKYSTHIDSNILKTNDIITKIAYLYNNFKEDFLLKLLEDNMTFSKLAIKNVASIIENIDKKEISLFKEMYNKLDIENNFNAKLELASKLFNAGEFDLEGMNTTFKKAVITNTTNSDKFINDPKFLSILEDTPAANVFILSEAEKIEKPLSDFILKKVINEKLEYGQNLQYTLIYSKLTDAKLPKYKFYENLATLSDISDDDDFYNELSKLYGTSYTNAIKNNILISKLKKDLYSSPISPEINLTSSEISSILKLNGLTLKSSVRKKKKQSIKEWAEEIKKAVDPIPDMKIEKDENTKEDLEKLTAIINKKYNKRKHGSIGPKVVETFTATFSDSQYKQFLKDNEGTEQIIPAFHGTGSVAASFILRNGFTIVKKDTAGIKVTGKALGNGIYFTNVLDKVTQYVGEGFTRRRGTTGYIFEMKAALGTKNKDYRAGGLPGTMYSNWVSPEWAVYNPDKQLHIVKVMKVELVDFEDIDEYIEKHKDSILDENTKVKTFNEFLNEKKNAYTGNTTRFIFRDENIPVSKEGTFIHYSKVNWKKLLGNRGWMEKTQDGVCVVFKSEDYQVFDIPYILKFFREEKSKNAFYKLNKW